MCVKDVLMHLNFNTFFYNFQWNMWCNLTLWINFGNHVPYSIINKSINIWIIDNKINDILQKFNRKILFYKFNFSFDIIIFFVIDKTSFTHADLSRNKMYVTTKELMSTTREDPTHLSNPPYKKRKTKSMIRIKAKYLSATYSHTLHNFS